MIDRHQYTFSHILNVLRWCIFLCSMPVASAQQAPADSIAADYVVIDTICINDNLRTRKSLILRELEFRQGDTLQLRDLGATLQRNTLRLLNMGIFNDAGINVVQWKNGNHIELGIRLVEDWFIYPVPLFELADRNFNVWWKEFNRSLRRVNYGFDISHINFSGNADVLKAKFQFGYSNKYELSYSRPNINHRQTLGIQTAVSYSRTHEIAYATGGNKLLFMVDPDAWLMTRFYATLGLRWRPQLFATHVLRAEYHDNRTTDSVVALNPDFFLNGNTQQRHLSMVYSFVFDRLDIRPYPLSGYWVNVELRRNGFLPADNLRIFRLFAEYDQYFSFSKKWSLETAFIGRMTLPRSRIPYFNNQALGYGGTFVRGYEYYVADGIDYTVLKTGLHFELFNRSFNLGRFMPLKAFKTFPLKIYLALNNDAGYANDPFYSQGNPLTNRWLYGYGLGLDVVAYYDKTARFEWSRNDLGESGFFVRINAGF